MDTRKWVGLTMALFLIAIMCKVSFGGVSDSVFDRNRPGETKGWTIFASDNDIDATAELITELATTYAQLAAEDKIEIVSAGAGDTTQTVTIYGINSSGKKASESISLTGATAATSDTTWRYIDQVEVDAKCAGVITIRRGTGDTFITSIPAGRLDAQMAQHFNGDYFSYITNWRASVTATTDTVTFELRAYPDDASCLTATLGYKVLDEMAISGAGTDERCYGQPIKISKGSWIAVYGKGATADTKGNTSIEGVDLKQ